MYCVAGVFRFIFSLHHFFAISIGVLRTEQEGKTSHLWNHRKELFFSVICNFRISIGGVYFFLHFLLASEKEEARADARLDGPGYRTASMVCLIVVEIALQHGRSQLALDNGTNGFMALL